MRSTRKILVALVLAVVASVAATPARAEVSFDFFYSNLEPHGSWLVSAEYGRVWQPREYARGWNPYYDGHWLYTEVGWTWVSDYRWGTIPYHYGTWVMDARNGWVWIPGYTWAPAWVTFRTGPDYIGWAPVEPSFAVGISFGGPAPFEQGFVFVSNRDFVAPRIRTCVLPESRSRVVINNTTVVNNLYIQNNVVVNRGPDVRVVERASGKRISKVKIENVTRVAPFTSVTRSRLEVDGKNARAGIRVTAPRESTRTVLSEPDRRQRVEPRAPQGSNRQEPRNSQIAPSRPGPDQRDTRVAPQPTRKANPDARKQEVRKQEVREPTVKKPSVKKQDAKKKDTKKKDPKKQKPKSDTSDPDKHQQ